MNYEKAVKALNNSELQDIAAAVATHGKRFEIVAEKFYDWRAKTSAAFVVCAGYIPEPARQLILDDLQASVYLYEDLAECLIMLGQDTTRIIEHHKDVMKNLREAVNVDDE
jgi:hypothetical protein